MTMQWPDLLNWRDESWVITAVRGSGLFDPADHGIQVYSTNNACWRGYIAWYAVQDDRLLLWLAFLELDGEDTTPVTMETAPTLFGKRPLGLNGLIGAHYGDLNALVSFTGTLFVGKSADGMPRLALPWAGDTCFALVFDAGVLTATHDLSAAAAKARELPSAAEAAVAFELAFQQVLAVSPR